MPKKISKELAGKLEEFVVKQSELEGLFEYTEAMKRSIFALLEEENVEETAFLVEVEGSSSRYVVTSIGMGISSYKDLQYRKVLE